MHPLTAVMPNAEVPRSDVVAARVARKVGPLFGVVWEQNPFGHTWVCDFGSITLAEIARGAPYPERAVQSAMDGQAAQEGLPRETASAADGEQSGTWRLAGRSVWTFQRAPTPAAIAYATLNRYGPDTKAAVVLVGANRLLRDVTTAIASVCRHLDTCGASVEMRLAIWAGLMLEAFRGQPALVAAAIQARDIQRALTTPWGEHLWLSGLRDSARCEFGAEGETRSSVKSIPDPLAPVEFSLIDSTLPLLGLPLPVEDGPLLSQREVLDDIATRWCRRLMQIGQPGRGVTWVSERVPDHRSVESYVRIGSAIAPFVAEVFSMLSVTEKPGHSVDTGQLARVLAGIDYASLAGPARRAHLVSAHTLVNYLRFHDNLLRTQPEVRVVTRAFLRRVAADAAQYLGPDDPVALLLDTYGAYCTVWDLARGDSPGGTAADEAGVNLARQLDRVRGGWLAGALDPGTSSYLLEIGVMALDLLDAPNVSGDALAGLWRDAMLARGVDPGRALDSPLTLPEAQRYHLQNYAAFIAARATGEGDLRRALAAQRSCVRVRDLVTRGELAGYEAKFTSARTSRQAAAAIVAELLKITDPAEISDGRDLLAEGVAHARAAMDNPTTRSMLRDDRADLDVVRLAVAVLPAVAAALDWDRRATGGDPLVDEDLCDVAAELLGAAVNAAARLGDSLSDRNRKVLDDLASRQASLPTDANATAVRLSWDTAP